MAITDITDEVGQLRLDKALDNRIDLLSQERAAFVLKILMTAEHISSHTMTKALDLADTVVSN